MSSANLDGTPVSRDARPLQFGLKTLFWVITGLCALFTIMAVVGWMWSAMLVMLLLLIGGHVLGNALGTSLRNEASETPPPVLSEPSAARPVHQTTGLQEKHSQMRLILLVGAIGAALGALLGGACVAWHDWQHMTFLALLLGATACAVLGGLLSFLASCGLRITVLAWREMWHSHKSQT
jgi:hypothetical protein